MDATGATPARSAPPAAGQPPAAVLSPEQLDQLAQAALRAKKVLKAGGVAMFNGCTAAFFAGCCLLFVGISALLGEVDAAGLVMGVALGLVAYHEFKGRRLLRRFDLRGPRLLGWNQVCLMVLLMGYCGWQIANACLRANPYTEAMEREPMLADTLGPIGELYLMLTLAVYGGVIVGTAVFQGLNAAYYFTRGRHLRAYLDETPDWIVEIQRRSAGA